MAPVEGMRRESPIWIGTHDENEPIASWGFGITCLQIAVMNEESGNEFGLKRTHLEVHLDVSSAMLPCALIGVGRW